MREILFRGKRVDNGEWVEGLLFYHYDSFYEEYRLHIQKVKPKVSFEIDPNTVCQFTGLVDRYNKKIFENDIVSCPEPYGVYCGEIKGKVVYKISSFVMEYRKFNIPLRNDIPKPEFCVIGNIYDNKDLIGESV